MKPTSIIEKPPIMLVGLSFFGDPFNTSTEWTEENEIGRLWKRFIFYMANKTDQIKHITNNKVAYEVHVMCEETESKGHWEIFVGLEVSKLEDIPVEVLVKILPATTYAVFTLEGQQITSDWPREIYYEWLPGSGYQSAYNYSFQLYDERFKGVDNIDESVLDVYVPVRRKA